MYTMDPEQMLPVTGYKEKEQNQCDVCGGALLFPTATKLALTVMIWKQLW